MTNMLLSQRKKPRAIKPLRGAIFTRREVVDFILNLSGYTSDKSLYEARILEPSFGQGDFLLPIIQRLIKSYLPAPQRRHREDLKKAIKAVEIDETSYSATAKSVEDILIQMGISGMDARYLREHWLSCEDFLFYNPSSYFDYIVGNPPYIRQESISVEIIREYKKRFKTISDRADIYIPFFENSLRLLNHNGVLGFICADRWTKNRYGRLLRQYISEKYSLDIFVDMEQTDAFTTKVVAYPAVFIISRNLQKKTRVTNAIRADSNYLSSLSKELQRGIISNDGVYDCEVVNGNSPWITKSYSETRLFRCLEEKLPVLESTGCKVGIGVASGADKVYIAPFRDLDVEKTRKLPLAMTRDIVKNQIEWQGAGIVNPFDDNGKLVDLHEFPKLKRYLMRHRDVLCSRYVATKNPKHWYRTIDRIYSDLAGTPKLLIPDIRNEAHVIYDRGSFYPHHNFYYIKSKEWNLLALRAVLLSKIARMFIQFYSTRMRGGYLRFQAQYIRRIRLPYWKDISLDLRKQLIAVGSEGNLSKCDLCVSKLYQPFLNCDEEK